MRCVKSRCDDPEKTLIFGILEIGCFTETSKFSAISRNVFILTDSVLKLPKKLSIIVLKKKFLFLTKLLSQIKAFNYYLTA